MSILQASTEELIPLNSKETRELIPGNPTITTLWRWVARGLNASSSNGPRVKLEVVYVGRKPFTTVKAIRDFIKRTTIARNSRVSEVNG